MASAAKKSTGTATATTTPDGRKGLRLTCSCRTHKGATVVKATPTAAADFPTDRIHSYVAMAYSPVNRINLNLWTAEQADGTVADNRRRNLKPHVVHPADDVCTCVTCRTAKTRKVS